MPSFNGFSVVVINDSGLVLKKDALSLAEVMETARSFKVDAIAVDNIFELGEEAEIRRFSAALSDIEIIQVTGPPGEGARPLSSIGKEMGLTSGEKLTPLRSAEVAATAARAGLGSLVRLFEPETRISISRRRRFGTGGMSEGRFRRSIQGSVLNLTKSIEASLRSKGIDFDLKLRRGSHGVEGSTFFVYAPRNRLIGIVRPLRTSSIDVRVTPVYTKSLEYEPLGRSAEARPKRHIILGVDPGMVTGLAAVDLNGRVLKLTSGRGITRGQITRWASELGRATVVASDVNPPPALVEKLAASLGAILFAPEASLKALEKKTLAERVSQEQGKSAQDTHQRAALAAALKAFSLYKNKLEQAGAHARREGRAADVEEVKANVLRGMSINDAIEAARLPVFQVSLPARRRVGSEREQIRVLESKCQELREERDALEEKIESLKARVEELENQLRLERLEPKRGRTKEGEIYELERRISSLLGENSSLRGKVELLQSEVLNIRGLLEAIASGDAIALQRHGTLPKAIAAGGAVSMYPYVLAESVGRLDRESLVRLKGLGLRAIVLAHPSSDDLALLWDVGIPVIHLSWLTPEAAGGVEVVRRVSMEEAYKRAKEEMESSVLIKGKRIRQIFEEYRKERLKGA